MSSVSQILQQMAENASRAQLQRGGLIGAAISDASQVPAQIMADRQKQAILQRQQAQQDALAGYANERNTREQKDQARQDAEAARKLQEEADRKAIIGAGLDTTGPAPSWKIEPAILEATRRGRSDIAKELIDAHNKTTEFDPNKGEKNAAGVITRLPVSTPKIPEIGTPAYEIYARSQELQQPPAAPPPPAGAALPPSAPMPMGGMAAPPPVTAVAPNAHAGDPSWTREDGAPKGNGFLGVLKRPDGRVSSEISIGVMINGKEVEVPTLVPTLTSVEKNWLLTHDISDPSKIPMPIQQKAIDFAKTRIAAGKSPFAGPEDSPATPPTGGLTPNAAILKAYADQREAAAKATHSPIYKEWKDYTDQGGKLGFDAYMTADANRKKPVVNVTGANAPPPPGDFAKTGEDFLATIPVQWRATVKKIASYDEDPSKVASMRGGSREMVMQWVNQVNPKYDAGLFTNRAPTRKAFTTGTQGQQINAINTAIGHIDQLTTLAADLPNGRFVPGNKAVNAIATMFGANAATNFDTLKDALAGEVSAVLAKGGATVSGIAEAKEKIHASNSPQQLAGYVKTLVPIFGSKLAALDDQYKQAMGDDSFSALSNESKRILTKHGFDPAHPTIGGGGGGGGLISVTDPKGGVHQFPTQAAADAFKKAAGIP